jgi:hypothetical protein
MQLFTLMRNLTADQAGFREPFAELGRVTDYDEDDSHRSPAGMGDTGIINLAEHYKSDGGHTPNTTHLKAALLHPDPQGGSSSSWTSSQPGRPGSRNKLKFSGRLKPNAHLTVLLDYHAYNPANRWLKAGLNGHFHLALAFLLSLIFFHLRDPPIVCSYQ